MLSDHLTTVLPSIGQGIEDNTFCSNRFIDISFFDGWYRYEWLLIRADLDSRKLSDTPLEGCSELVNLQCYIQFHQDEKHSKRIIRSDLLFLYWSIFNITLLSLVLWFWEKANFSFL